MKKDATERQLADMGQNWFFEKWKLDKFMKLGALMHRAVVELCCYTDAVASNERAMMSMICFCAQLLSDFH